MLLWIYLTIEILTLIFFGLTFTQLVGPKSKDLVGYFSVMLFIFLAISSFSLQTENCDQGKISDVTDAYNYVCYSCTGNSMPTLLGNNSQISSITHTFNYAAPVCIVSYYIDSNMAWFNISLAFLSLIYAIAMTMMRGMPDGKN